MLTILIVDNNEIDRSVYCRYLNRATDFDCATLEADSGEAGLALCQQAQPNVQ